MTPELDLTPEEINDPQMMQLWVAPHGTPLPTAWNGGVDMAFRFVGMIRRDVQAKPADVRDITPLGGPQRRPRDRDAPELTFTWHRLLGKHAAVLPLRRYCSALFAMPAERARGVAPRVALKDFEQELWGEGASCTAVLEKAEPFGEWLAWYAEASIAAG